MSNRGGRPVLCQIIRVLANRRGCGGPLPIRMAIRGTTLSSRSFDTAEEIIEEACKSYEFIHILYNNPREMKYV